MAPPDRAARTARAAVALYASAVMGVLLGYGICRRLCGDPHPPP